MTQQPPGKVYDLPLTLKLRELCEKFSEAIAEDKKTNSWTKFDSFTETVLSECMDLIRRKYSVGFPTLRTKLCNQKQFDAERSRFAVSRDTRAFIVHPLGLVVVNLEEAMKWNAESFLSNMALDFMEELTHAAFGPSHGEVRTKMKVHELIEQYLGTALPDDYKKMSLERARQQDFGSRSTEEIS